MPPTLAVARRLQLLRNHWCCSCGVRDVTQHCTCSRLRQLFACTRFSTLAPPPPLLVSREASVRVCISNNYYRLLLLAFGLLLLLLPPFPPAARRFLILLLTTTMHLHPPLPRNVVREGCALRARRVRPGLRSLPRSPAPWEQHAYNRQPPDHANHSRHPRQHQTHPRHRYRRRWPLHWCLQLPRFAISRVEGCHRRRDIQSLLLLLSLTWLLSRRWLFRLLS